MDELFGAGYGAVPRGVMMKRILLVEDEEHIRTLVALILESAGYQVDAARSVTGAREYIRIRSYDLVLTDFKLGDGDGVSVADTAIEKGAKAIIVTGYVEKIAMTDRARHEVLAKPLRPSELVQAVERHIGQA